MEKYLVLPLVLFALFGAAGAQERGRLPDGRAYRTGADGVEIVDYIAELELVNADLQDRIRSLQNEIDERGQLLAQKNTEASTQRVPESQFNKLQGELQREQSRSNELKSKLLDIESAYKAQVQDLETLRSLHREALTKLQDSEKGRLKVLERERESYQKQIQQVAAKGRQLEEENVRLETALAEARSRSQEQSQIQEELRVTKLKLDDALDQLKQYETRASLRPSAPKNTYKPSLVVNSARPHPSKNYIPLFKEKYQTLGTLARERDLLDQKLARLQGAIRLSTKMPKSRRGISLSYLAGRYKVIVNNSSNARNFLPDLLDLEVQYKKDIGAAERVLGAAS
ncbi:MAG: hypothetical protein KDD62_05370 [Bdellovibrionales bacterium]|nr:hypothetical protein [Bdellovibrionales bacterium]